MMKDAGKSDQSPVERRTLHRRIGAAATLSVAARRDVAAAIGGGQAVEAALAPLQRHLSARRAGPADHAAASITAAIEGALDGVRPAPDRRTSTAPMIAIRHLPLGGLGEALAAEWTHGLRPDLVHGPFTDITGELFWIDVFRPIRLVRLVARSGPFGTPRLLALIPTRATAMPARRALRLAAGSLWLPTTTLVAGRPGNEFAGLRIRSGSLTIRGNAAFTGDTIEVAGSWQATIAAATEPPDPPTAAAGGTGRDAVDARVVLPETVTFAFASGGTAVTPTDMALRAYGTDLALTRNDDAPFHDAATRSIVVPCKASAPRFRFTALHADLLAIGPSARIVSAGWALPITETTADKLAQASGAGSLWVKTGAGLAVQWQGQPLATKLGGIVLVAAPDKIQIIGTLATAADHRLLLWSEAGEAAHRSSIDLHAPAGALFLYQVQAGTEALIVWTTARAHLDRPLAADGRRLALAMPIAILGLVKTTDVDVYLLAADPGAAQKAPVALALRNALLKLRPAAWLWLGGTLDVDGVASGTLSLRFAMKAGLPTLPDPYASNFPAAAVGALESDGGATTTIAAVEWTAPEKPTLAFTLDNGAAAPPPAAIHDRDGRGTLTGTPGIFLLDLSSNADQFGVGMRLVDAAHIALRDMALVAPADRVHVFTPPPISWEPMLTAPPQPGSGDPVLAPAPHDGGPAFLNANDVTLVPVVPTPVLLSAIKAVQGDRHFTARLPLPFGIVGQIDTTDAVAGDMPSIFQSGGGRIELNQPLFTPSLRGGLQVTLAPPKAGDPKIDPTFPGHTSTVDDNDYAKGVLSENIRTRWLGDFGPGKLGVPVERYDLSGYGASLFSDWRNSLAAGPAIVQARFDVLVGRTAHEVVQMQSILYPWAIRVVRTITIERRAAGWILREDSGWIAASDGRFDFPSVKELIGTDRRAFAGPEIHRGAIAGVVAVRNIRMTGAQFTVGSGADATIYQPAIFDADVLIDKALPVGAGGTKTAEGTRVAGQGIEGYIQIDGPSYGVTNDAGQPIIQNGQPLSLVAPASRRQIFDLLALKGSARAPLACLAEAGGVAGNPGLALRAVLADVSCDDNAASPHLVAALRGTPAMPRDGAWTLGRIRAGETAPSALDAGFAVPLVRPSLAFPGNDRWHLGDPADIRRLGPSGAPTVVYGMLQSTGTQKMFLARPQITDGADPVKLPETPKLADMAGLFNAAGIFPDLGDAFAFASTKALKVDKGDFALAEEFPIQKVGGKARETKLMGIGAVKAILRYEDEAGKETLAKVKVDPAATPRWSVRLERVRFAVQFNDKDLISIYANVIAEEGQAPTVRELNVRYESFLSALQAIFSNIQQVARFLPGGKSAGLKVGFSDGKLSVTNSFALPNLPLGTGQLTDIACDMGFQLQLAPVDVTFVAGLGTSQNPFKWIVSPLAGTGVVRVGINKEGLDVLVQAGLGVALAIDLGIAAGSASITLALELNTGPDPFELKAILAGRASVDVLRGLASATITLAAGLGIIPPSPSQFPALPPPFPTQLGPFTIGFTASVAVGIHITICWVVDIDWDDYWQFRQDITTPAISLPALPV